MRLVESTRPEIIGTPEVAVDVLPKHAEFKANYLFQDGVAIIGDSDSSAFSAKAFDALEPIARMIAQDWSGLQAANGRFSTDVDLVVRTGRANPPINILSKQRAARSRLFHTERAMDYKSPVWFYSSKVATEFSLGKFASLGSLTDLHPCDPSVLERSRRILDGVVGTALFGAQALGKSIHQPEAGQLVRAEIGTSVHRAPSRDLGTIDAEHLFVVGSASRYRLI